MSSCAFLYPCWSDIGPVYAPAFAAFGSWSVSLPLTNLQSTELALVARSTDALAASTKFRLDLGVARQVGGLVLIGHNISLAGTVRWRGYSDAGYSVLVYDSTTLDVWPVVYPAGSLAPGDPRLVTGKYSAEEATQSTPDCVHVPVSLQSARYWMCEITDTANLAGYVQIGQLLIANRYAPTFTINYGAKLQLATATTRTETDGGASVFDPKPVRRMSTFRIANNSENETYANIYEMQRRLGTSGLLYFLYDTGDTHHMTRRSYRCTFKELSALEDPWCARTDVSYALIEEF